MAAAIRTFSILAGSRNLQLPFSSGFSLLKCLQARQLSVFPHPKLQSPSRCFLQPTTERPNVGEKWMSCYTSALSTTPQQIESNLELFKHHNKHSLLSHLLPSLHQVEQRRSVVKFSLRKGKRKTVKAVVDRFFRLRWGAWIRPRSGAAKHLWKKSPQRKARLRKHVFCNSTQNRMLDIMVTKYWKRPRYYVDDPYEPYHKRHSIYPKKL